MIKNLSSTLLLLVQATCSGDELYSAQMKCCQDFSFKGVVARSKVVLRSRKEPLLVVRFSTNDYRGSAGVVHESPLSCIQFYLSMTKCCSHAFLFRTAIGSAVYYWDHHSMNHRTLVLDGSDPLGKDSDGNRIAMIKYNRVHSSMSDNTVNIWVVAEDMLTMELAKAKALRITQALSLKNSVIYIRNDPWYWPAGCYPYSLPIHWESKQPSGNEKAATYVCIQSGSDSRCSIVESLI